MIPSFPIPLPLPIKEDLKKQSYLKNNKNPYYFSKSSIIGHIATFCQKVGCSLF
jgi:hypothetical protein